MIFSGGVSFAAGRPGHGSASNKSAADNCRKTRRWPYPPGLDGGTGLGKAVSRAVSEDIDGGTGGGTRKCASKPGTRRGEGPYPQRNLASYRAGRNSRPHRG